MSFKNIGTKVLETEHLILEKVTYDLADFMYDNIYGVEEVAKFIHNGVHKSINQTRELFKQYANSYDDLSFYRWVMYEKSTHSIVGTCGGYKSNTSDQDITLSCYLVKNHWKKGYGMETISRMVKFFFEEVGVRQIISYVYQSNYGSCRIMDKLGFVGTFVDEDEVDKVNLYILKREDYFNKLD